MNLPPMPDEFIAHREWLYQKLPEGRWAHKIGSANPAPFWREFRYSTDHEIEMAWMSACADAAYEASKKDRGLIGRQVIFTPETVVRGKPDANISGIAIYRLETWQRHDDDWWSLPVQMLTCSALADEGVYLERVDSDKRGHFFYVPNEYIQFAGLAPDDVREMRPVWLAKRKAEPHQPFVGKTIVRHNAALPLSPYDQKMIVLHAGDEIEISERYHAPLLFPGTTTEGTKHFDVRTKDGTVIRGVYYECLAVNGGWNSPDLPYAGTTILDECRVRF